MNPKPQPPRRLHRAAVIVVLLLFSVVWLLFTIPDPSRIDRQSLSALGVVVLVAAVGGIGVSWGRWFGRR